MTSSKSRASISKWLQIAAVLFVGWCVLAPSPAAADRKRVVVLELKGPKAERFQKDLIKSIKKSHSVVPLSRWNRTADKLGAGRPTAANIRKVAKKLKIDVVIQGEVKKRRDAYILRLELRSGSSGDTIGNGFETKSDDARITGSAKRDVDDELVALISAAKADRFASSRDDDDDDDDDEEDEPRRDRKSKKKRVAKADRDDEEDDDEEERPRKKRFSRKASRAKDRVKDRDKGRERDRDDDEADEDDDDERGSRRRVASRDDDDDDDDDDEPESIRGSGAVAGLAGADALRPGERAIDFALGLSFNARRMSFTHEASLGNRPPPYKGVPVAGALIDATVYPLAFGHERRDITKNLGLNVLYDKVLKIDSKQGGVVYPTSQGRWAVGATFRYPVGKATLGAALRYGKQSFTITTPAGAQPVDTPNVSYTMFEPMVSVRYEATPKVLLNVHAGFLAVTDTGPIQKMDQYGPATVTGIETELGADYLLTKNLFARAAFRLETFGYSFKGGAMMSNMRDSDPEQDVFGARDTYVGGSLSLGYLY